MFNEYEVYLLSKLKKEEFVEVSAIHNLIAFKQGFKSKVKALVKTKQIDSTLCCESACC